MKKGKIPLYLLFLLPLLIFLLLLAVFGNQAVPGDYAGYRQGDFLLSGLCDIQVEPYVFEVALERLRDGSIQMFDIFPSEKRAEYYLFTDVIYTTCGVILATESSGIHSAEERRPRPRVASRPAQSSEGLKPETSLRFAPRRGKSCAGDKAPSASVSGAS